MGKEYFRSWYYNITTDRGGLVLIPGISTDRYGITHAFVQMIDGFDNHSYYFTYPPSEFAIRQTPFSVSVGPNYFSESFIRLEFQTKRGKIIGEIALDGGGYKKNWRPHPVFSPTGMGCAGHILCPRGEAAGYLIIEHKEYLFPQGSFYLESRKGRCFPLGWMWLQCSDFTQDISLMFCLSRFSFGKLNYPYFFSFIGINGQNHIFSGFGGAKMTGFCSIDNCVTIEIENKSSALKITARPDEGLPLRAPDRTGMERFISQSLHTEMEIEFHDKKAGRIIGEKSCGGFESYGVIFS